MNANDDPSEKTPPANRNARSIIATGTEPAQQDDHAEETRTIAEAVGGDKRATARLLAKVQPLVIRYCRARIGRQERSFASADDVAQDVCAAVLTALPGYRDQGRPFLAFVYGIAAHKVTDAHRAVMRNRSTPVPDLPDRPDYQPGPEEYALRAELTEEMGKLLKVLPARQQDILVLRLVLGFSAEETAKALESTPGAVRVAQHRALNRLRTQLAARLPALAG